MKNSIAMISALILTVIFCVSAYADLISPPFTYPDIDNETVSEESATETDSVTLTDEAKPSVKSESETPVSNNPINNNSGDPENTVTDTVSETAGQTKLTGEESGRSAPALYIVAKAAGICAVALAFIVVVRKKRKPADKQ